MESGTNKDMEQSMIRWRLILGQDSQERFGKMGGGGLSSEMDMMDQALAAIYNLNSPGSFASGGPGGVGGG
ncbi:MAG: hypothetical protein K2N63_04010, partial [Lachnospiraceae bacterium]|nr:hypothetical protein [Lachnospiraceae bacterium]